MSCRTHGAVVDVMDNTGICEFIYNIDINKNKERPKIDPADGKLGSVYGTH